MTGDVGDIARLFLKLGAIGFGGPAAHIAMMEDEVVARRGWMERERFLDLLGATNLIPGPNSTELAIHIGHARAGWRGLVVAGICFIAPAVAIVTAIAWAYVRFGALPAAGAILHGVKPVVIAIVVQALWRLARTAVTTPWLLLLGLVSTAAVAAGMNELLLLVLAGGGAWLVRSARGVTAAPLLVAPFGLIPLFAVFAKIGAVLFGSGYVLLAFLRSDLVERLGWITERQLLDAVAVGQVTPGPVFTTATFIGYLVGGPAGAAVATVGIFLPAFVFVALSGPLIPRIRSSPRAGAALDAVNVASLALMAVVSWQLAASTLVDTPTIFIGAIAFLLLLFRINSAWLILAGAIVGLLLQPAASGITQV